MKFIVLLLCLAAVNCQMNFPEIPQIKIGALFYDNEFEIEEAFVQSIEFVNTLSKDEFLLQPIVMRLNTYDSTMFIEKYACDLLDMGVAAIFGPSSRANSDVVAVLANITGIPNILFDAIIEEPEEQKAGHQLTVNVYPAQQMISKAYSDIIHNYGWRKFNLVYDIDDDTAPMRLQDIIQLRDLYIDAVRLRKYRKGDDYRNLWKSMKGDRRVILDCPADILVEMLNASIPFDMTGQFNHLFLTNLENLEGILEPLRHNETFALNITAVRFKERPTNLPNLNQVNNEPSQKLLPKLIHDAVMLYYLALKNITTHYIIEDPPRYTCENLDFSGEMGRWPFGEYIRRIMGQASFLNDSYFHYGSMQFDNYGHRTQFEMEIYEPMDNYSLAVCHTNGHIYNEHISNNITKKIVYKVATRIGAPYFMERENATDTEIMGSSRYTGYVVDLIDELSKEMQFEYVFVPVPGNGYGKYNKETKRWDGIIGEIINNDAHMGLCDLTITQARKEVVDFSVPFMTLGISILAYKKPVERKSWSAFLEPFQSEVWVYVMASIFIISFLYFAISRITVGDWENPHPCNKNPDVVENRWTISNSIWITIGSIMTAGCDILPTHSTMRIFTTMFWIFAIIINNSYTANMAAFLTNSKMEGSINSIADLAGQNEVKFGTIEGGSTYSLFAESNETTYRLAFNRMQGSEPPVYTKDNNEGVERVLKNNGSYMFLMETTSLEYNTERNCKLQMLGETFGEKHYAIAVPFGAEYRHSLNVAILRLAEKGILPSLKQKWWKNTNNSCDHEEAPEKDTPDLTFDNVRGIFYTLYVGIFIAYIIGITDFLLYTHHVAAEEGLTFKQAFLKEIKFVLNIWNNKKPVSKAPSTRSNSLTTSEKSSKSCSKSTKSLRSCRSLQKKKTIANGDVPEVKSVKSLKSCLTKH
ncbi:glutamate receptor ionotropic, kainate 2-like [Musca vetustissima]|uniref:glutamate receptor ionotropic, kainate 2-like n=1 Tax=Musca vetustissima TaxID=27455 RepID=UPI002AB74128|nr:glutamate receptor ionotropic, kainate 2-like [Musca vetustissima]